MELKTVADIVTGNIEASKPMPFPKLSMLLMDKRDDYRIDYKY